jgi:stress-induced-phosphoprotein 1
MEKSSLKDQADALFRSQNYPSAITLYTQAIEQHSSEDLHNLYSNRSAAQHKLGNFQAALKDADACVELKPEWAKGYRRAAAAFQGLGNAQKAKEYYKKVMELEPENKEVRT